MIGVGSVWLGLVISYYLGTAGSATMALIPVLVFFLILIAKRSIGALANRRVMA
jgi:ABC-type Mn2+/Zn2+ transport system permease subunit